MKRYVKKEIERGQKRENFYWQSDAWEVIHVH